MIAALLLQVAAITCTPVAIYDADGPIWCAEGPRIRIAGIAARELDGTCRRNHPCPAMGPMEARQTLVRIMGAQVIGTRSTGHLNVRAAPMQCVSIGTSYNRQVASCTLPDGRDLRCAMIATGAAVDWPRYSRGMRRC